MGLPKTFRVCVSIESMHAQSVLAAGGLSATIREGRARGLGGKRVTSAASPETNVDAAHVVAGCSKRTRA
jgi:hypothetical protein